MKVCACVSVGGLHSYCSHCWPLLWLQSSRLELANSHTWADTCRCPQSQTPSERVRVRRETCDLFCLNKVWLLQMNSNCWYYRVIRVTHTHAQREWPANTLRICHTHTRCNRHSTDLHIHPRSTVETHKQTRMSRKHIHTPLLLRRFKSKRSCKMSSCLRCVNPVFSNG